MRPLLLCLVTSLLSVACVTRESAPITTVAGADETNPADQTHPEVLDATFELSDDGTWDIAVTLSSPYDTPDRYADAWRVTSIGGTTIYGIRELTHDHANEQPFTRQQSGIEIPPGNTTVLVQGRDLLNGWGVPKQFELPLG